MDSRTQYPWTNLCFFPWKIGSNTPWKKFPCRFSMELVYGIWFQYSMEKNPCRFSMETMESVHGNSRQYPWTNLCFFHGKSVPILHGQFSMHLFHGIHGKCTAGICKVLRYTHIFLKYFQYFISGIRGVLHALKSLFDHLTYVVGTQKKHVNETILLSTHNIGFALIIREKLWDRKLNTPPYLNFDQKNS